MCADYQEFDLPVSSPFWFASVELLTNLFHSEVAAIIDLFAKHRDLRKLFDSPEATVSQRTVCFELLVHRKMVDMIDDDLVGRYEESLVLSDEEVRALRDSQGLVTSDAPAWALEMNEVVEWLPVRIRGSLPEPLRTEGWYRNDPAKDEAVLSGAKALDTIEQIQELTARVSDDQLRRLKERWLAAVRQAGQPGEPEPKKPKHWLKGVKGLTRKRDMSRYMHGLTDKQQLALSLKLEYELPLWEIASRMGVDRKTAYDHIKAAERNIDYGRSNEQRQINRGKHQPE